MSHRRSNIDTTGPASLSMELRHEPKSILEKESRLARKGGVKNMGAVEELENR